MAELESSKVLRAVPHEMIVRTGEFRGVLSELIAERDVNLVVIATHAAGGLSKLVWGSTAESILREVMCPVMIAGPNVAAFEGDRFGRILYATNFSDASEHALPYAISMAQRHQSGLTMLHGIPWPRDGGDPDQLKREAGDTLRERFSSDGELWCEPEIIVEFGEPWEVVVRASEKQRTDLIVMGAHPTRTASTYLPSTVHRVLRHAHCPVLTVRGGDK